MSEDELLSAAKGLCEKLRLIHEDPLFQSVWFSAANHGIDYSTGPTYVIELERLEAAVKASQTKSKNSP